MPRTGGYYYGMKNRPYWAQRAKESLSESFATAQAAEDYLTDRYKQSLLKFSKDYIDLVSPYVGADGELDINALQKDRYYNAKFAAKLKRVEDEIGEFSAVLNEETQAEVLDTLVNVYNNTVIDSYSAFGRNSNGLAMLNRTAVEAAVKQPYTRDGREFSDRIWTNLDNMNSNLRASLSRSIAEGRSIQKTTREFKDIFGNTTYNTTRIIRTETLATYSKASVASYRSLGVEKLRVLTESSACSVCAAHKDKEVLVSEARIGDTIPVFHPFCKCCVAPIVDWEKF